MTWTYLLAASIVTLLGVLGVAWVQQQRCPVCLEVKLRGGACGACGVDLGVVPEPLREQLLLLNRLVDGVDRCLKTQAYSRLQPLLDEARTMGWAPENDPANPRAVIAWLDDLDARRRRIRGEICESYGSRR